MKLYCNAHPTCLLLHGSYRVQIIAASGHSARDVFALESASGVDLSPVDQLLGVPLEHVVSVLVQSEFRVGAPDTDVCTERVLRGVFCVVAPPHDPFV